MFFHTVCNIVLFAFQRWIFVVRCIEKVGFFFLKTLHKKFHNICNFFYQLRTKTRDGLTLSHNYNKKNLLGPNFLCRKAITFLTNSYLFCFTNSESTLGGVPPFPMVRQYLDLDSALKQFTKHFQKSTIFEIVLVVVSILCCQMPLVHWCQ